jgi:hypothetical protein
MVGRLHDLLIPQPEPGGNDPISTTTTAGPTPAAQADDRPATRSPGEAPVPLNLHIADLLGAVVRDGGRPIDNVGDNWLPVIIDSKPRKQWTDNGWQHVGRREYRPAGDQIGALPVAHILDRHVRAWIDAGAPGSRWRPTPTVAALVGWLTARLGWACDNYPHIDAFAAAVSRLRGQMMAALGEFDPEAERCEGVECKRCDLKMLFRRQDGTGDVECQNPDCSAVMSGSDYQEWVKHLGGYEASVRSPQEVAELLRERTNRTDDLSPA